MELSDFKLGPAAYIVLAARDTAQPASPKYVFRPSVAIPSTSCPRLLRNSIKPGRSLPQTLTVYLFSIAINRRDYTHKITCARALQL
jgi:hypothetical protein